MARYTIAIKIFENENTHIYEICNDSKEPDCYAVIDTLSKNIKIFRDNSFEDLIFDYEEMKKNPDCIWPRQYLFIRILPNLISTINNNIFPKYLSRCS